MPNTKQDRALVASKQNNSSEVKTVCRKFKLPIALVRAAIKRVGINGSNGRSRRKIYAEIINLLVVKLNVKS